MLDPDARSLYSDALRPPPGYRLEQAIGATYSLDLPTLLSFPLHLAMLSGQEDLEALLNDSLVLLEAIRRTTEKMTVYCQRGAILAPGMPRALYSLLEPVVVEVTPPNPKGVFHAKFWLLRFEPLEGAASTDPLFRLMIPTRNVTADRCWDLSLVLEGVPRPGNRRTNREFANLVKTLPDLAVGEVPAARRQAAVDMASQALDVAWELPQGFEELEFFTFGLGKDRWSPRDANRVAVISPFLTEGAVGWLIGEAAAVALVSRPEELKKISPKLLKRFERVLTLHESAEREDGEEIEPSPFPRHGLHAKVIMGEKGWHSWLVTGSANATAAALRGGGNIEIIAELAGRHSKVGSIDKLLSSKGLGALLTAYDIPAEPEPVDEASAAAEEALRGARTVLGQAGLRLRCESEDGEAWRAAIVPPAPVGLEGLTRLRTWLVTRPDASAVDARDLIEGREVWFSPAALTTITGFVGFEIAADGGKVGEVAEQFVLNLPVDGVPLEKRDSAILRAVIGNREAFLRYLLLILMEAGLPLDALVDGMRDRGRRWGGASGADAIPLLEEMTRAFCRDRAKLDRIRATVADLRRDGAADVIPDEFDDLWRAFEAALAEAGTA